MSKEGSSTSQEKCRKNWLVEVESKPCPLTGGVLDGFGICADDKGFVTFGYFPPMKKELTLDQLIRLKILFNIHASELLARKVVP